MGIKIFLNFGNQKIDNGFRNKVDGKSIYLIPKYPYTITYANNFTLQYRT